MRKQKDGAVPRPDDEASTVGDEPGEEGVATTDSGTAGQNDSVVREAPDLLPEEKQFTITGVKSDDLLTVYTEIGSVTRALLVHSHAEVTRTERVDGDIVGVEVAIPISCVSIKAVPRSDDYWNAVVSTRGGEW